MRTDAGSIVGRRQSSWECRHNDNTRSWLMEIWWLATCGHGLHHCSLLWI